MKLGLRCLTAFRLFVIAVCAVPRLGYAAPSLERSESALPAQFDDRLWQERDRLVAGIDDNLRFLDSLEADLAYARFEREGIPRARVRKSLERFRILLTSSGSSSELLARVREEFELYRSRGRDGMGKVRFTGYFRPVYPASRVRTKEFRFPLFSKPAGFESWSKPHPTRVALEGYDGTGNAKGLLRGQEIAWLRERFEVYTIQIQGSAILKFTDGTQESLAFAAGTDYRFTGITREYLQERKLPWGQIGSYFRKNPKELNQVMAKNDRFIFFRFEGHPDPVGSLGLPVIPERSIATDKVVLPPGALGLIRTVLPGDRQDGTVFLAKDVRFVLDQDSGSAIKGPGRVDVFMGTGPDAQKKASWLYSEGELLYVLLKDEEKSREM